MEQHKIQINKKIRHEENNKIKPPPENKNKKKTIKNSSQ